MSRTWSSSRPDDQAGSLRTIPMGGGALEAPPALCLVASLSFMAALMGAIASHADLATGWRILAGAAGALVVGFLAWAITLVYRNRGGFTAKIAVEPSGVRLPVRRFGVIPFGDIAGVGLVRLRNPRSRASAGSWAIAVWRTDRSLAFAGAFQRPAEVRDPTRSRLADAARELHRTVADAQGPDGPLSRLHLQRAPRFGPFEPFTGSWDPVHETPGSSPTKVSD